MKMGMTTTGHGQGLHMDTTKLSSNLTVTTDSHNTKAVKFMSLVVTVEIKQLQEGKLFLGMDKL